MSADLEDRRAAFDRVVTTRDVALAADVLDGDFALVLVQPSAARMPRERWLAVLPDYVVHEWTVEDESLDVDGDTAVALRRVAMRATVLGEDRSGTFVITDVWRCRDCGWRIWRRHSTPLAAAALPGASRPETS